MKLLMICYVRAPVPPSCTPIPASLVAGQFWWNCATSKSSVESVAKT